MLLTKNLRRILALLTTLMVLFAMVLCAPAVSACTALELTSEEGDVFWFRTCDMDNTYNVFGENGSYIASSYLVSYPAGQPIGFVTGDLVPTHTVIGMSFADSLALLDGINDCGLTGGLLFLDEGTETLDEDVPEDYEIMAAMEGVTWFLAQCASVDEVIELANRTCIQALDVPGIPGSDLTATLHFNFVDPTGKSVVIEAANMEEAGFFTVYESIGVMTNSPPFDWQLQNFTNYIGDSTALQDAGITGITLNDVVLEGTPTGTAQSMPGTMSAPDRLVRLAMSRYFCSEGNTIPNDEMLARGSGIMATNNRPVEDAAVEGAAASYTQYTVCYDLSAQTMFIRPYDAVVWTSLSMDEANGEVRTQYPILRGGEGASVSSLSLNAVEEAPEEAVEEVVEEVVEEAPAGNNINTVLLAAVAVLGVAVVVLLILVLKKKQPQEK